LFTDRWPSDPHQLAILINRLSSRLGHEQVMHAKPRNSPVPERATHWQVATTHRTKQKLQNAKCKLKNANRQTKKKPSSAMNNLKFEICNLQSPRPLLLYPKPQFIEVVCVADGPPQFIWLENCREQIVHHVGPERIETLWWHGPTIRRDYYRIATESGSHLWIFRRLADTRWFLHGVFE
jgi:protein ImuB